MEQNNNHRIPWAVGDLMFARKNDKHFISKDEMDTTVYLALLDFAWQLSSGMTVERIIVNGPALVIFWKDGDKTVVKCHDEDFDIEKGIAMAIAKRVLGSRNKMNKLIKMVEYQDESQDKAPTSLKGKNILQVIFDELSSKEE